jgi:hypothetical protein
MSEQPDLFGRAALSVTPPQGSTQPVLWVRSLTIWREPGEPVRTITLRPGLNFVWSPDPADTQGVREPGREGDLGHGAGKTLFCRLLRYCLGEDSFAPEAQRLSIGRAFLNGWVSAEVMLHGQLWGVLRPLGANRSHFAVEGATSDQLFDRLDQPTGMGPLLKAIEVQLLTPDVARRMPVVREHDAWRVALAWLTRDQECRFDHVLDWRAAESDSDSPARARDMSKGRLQDAMRVLIGAISVEEIALQEAMSSKADAHKLQVQDETRRAWSCQRTRVNIIQTLGLKADDVPPGKLGIESLQQAARQRLARVSQISPGVDVSNLEDLRRRYRDAEASLAELTRKLAGLEGSLEPHQQLLSQYRADLPISSVKVRDAEVPLCQICEVPIDRVKAEGCKLSHKLPDLAELKKRHEELTQKVSQQEAVVAKVRSGIAELKQQLTPARALRDNLKQALTKAEKLNEQRSSAWFTARRTLDDIKRLGGDWDEWESVQRQVAEAAKHLEADRERLAAFRGYQAVVFDKLSAYFDAIIRTTVGPSASGRIQLDGQGLKLIVQFGGERSTPAIESLKVIAFDLAVLCMSIEGGTHLPAFLVHDSPREADLGLSVYHRLFSMVAMLEREGGSVFQYIVTTTTQPPANFQAEPWLRETLHGAPATDRLLRCDLP